MLLPTRPRSGRIIIARAKVEPRGSWQWDRFATGVSAPWPTRRRGLKSEPPAQGRKDNGRPTIGIEVVFSQERLELASRLWCRVGWAKLFSLGVKSKIMLWDRMESDRIGPSAKKFC